MRIVSMEKGDNVKRIIERFAKATSTIQECLKNEGYDFMHNDHLGWILTCPSNLGTGLRYVFIRVAKRQLMISDRPKVFGTQFTF